MSDFEGGGNAIGYTADGLSSSLSLGGTGDVLSSTYDETDSPSAIDLNQGSSTLLGFAYSYTPSGNVAVESDTPSSGLEPASYDYDAQSRVTSDTAGSNPALSYSEDASGNLTSLPTGASATYDDASELTSSTLSSTTTAYTYDAGGERLKATVGSTTTMRASYNGAGELTSYSAPAATLSAATYDGDGLRIADTVGPTSQSFIWDVTSSVPDLLLDGTNAYIYAGGVAPLEQVDLANGSVDYLVSDALGSVRGVISSNGGLSGSTSYDAWGNPETSGGLSSLTPFGFAGGYTDTTGLVYLINRYYDPTTGQFLSVDPMVSQTGQPYAYTRDNPVNGTDVTGLNGCSGGGGGGFLGCGTPTSFLLQPARPSFNGHSGCGAPAAFNYGGVILGSGAAGAASNSVSRLFNSAGDNDIEGCATKK